MTVRSYQISELGQVALPPETQRRWDLADGGVVEIADLGNALVVVPASRGGVRAIVRGALDDAGSYGRLASAVVDEEPDLA